MTEPQSFQADCIEIFKDKLARGEIDRRTALKLAAALGLAAVPSFGREAQAQAAEVIHVNWGGIANDAFYNHWGKPFEAANPGIKVKMDSSGPSAGKIRTMVESKKVTWDICDSSASSSILLGGQGLLEPVDYNIVKKSDLPPKGFDYPFGAAPYSFSTIITYDSAKTGKEPPKSMADFLDFKKYPGKRLLRKDAPTMIELLLMGDGVALDKVYPLEDTVKRGLEILKKHRKEFVYWTSGSESEQILRTGEAVMGVIWHTRSKVLFDETKGRINYTWNQGILQPGVQVILKGNPGGVNAQKYLASACANPGPQVDLLKFLGNGPTNPKASPMVPAEFRRFNPTDPDNAKIQLVVDGNYWGKNYPDINQQFLDIAAS